MTSTLERVEPPSVGRSLPPLWDVVRGLLLVAYVGLWLATLSTGVLEGSFGRLDRDLREGAVTTVQVAAPEFYEFEGTQGIAVRWRDGLLQRQTSLVWRQPGTDRLRPDGTQVVGTDPARWLSERYGVRVVRVPGDEMGPGQSIPAWRDGPEFTVPDWVHAWQLGVMALLLVHLIASPQPWRATRWAWAWLMLATPLAVVAYLLLSGRTPGVRDAAPDRRRLTGGWAFLLSLLLPGITASIASDVYGLLT